MPSEVVLDWAISNSDPANLVLLGVIWYRLDRRIKEVRDLVASGGSQRRAARSDD